MTAKKSNNSESVVINMGSSLTIDDIADINKQYQEAKKNNKSIELKANTIENIDLSGIQFLLHLKKSKPNQKFLSQLEFTDSITELINKSGFAKFSENE